MSAINPARSGKGYETRVWVYDPEKGRKVKRCLTFRTRRELEDALQDLKLNERRRRLGFPAERGEITYDRLADMFVAQYQHSDRSLRSLKERLRHSRRAFGSTNVRSIAPESIAVWNAKLDLNSTTRGHAHRAAKQVFAYGVELGYLAATPVRTKAPKPAVRQIRPFQSWKEVFQVAAKAGRYGPLIRFACATGLRPQEWMALEWRDVDFVIGELRVERTVQNGMVRPAAKTDGSLRSVQLQKVALDALHELPRPLAGGLIFTAPEGGIVTLSNYRRRGWKKALEAAEVEYRALDETRHTFATLALAAGAPVEWVSKQLGHTNVNTTMRYYARFLPVTHKRNLAILDRFAAESDRDGLKKDASSDA